MTDKVVSSTMFQKERERSYVHYKPYFRTTHCFLKDLLLKILISLPNQKPV